MNKTNYKWYLSVDDGANLQRVYPVYKGDLALDYELETGQYFHRAKLSGKLDFVGTDYDWIMSQSFESLYHLYIKISYDRGATYSDYWHGTFVRTDCEVNVDDKKIVVQPQVRDRYTKVLDGMEREYDLIRDLNPNRTTIESTKRGYWQIYKPDSEKICNIYDGDVIVEDVELEIDETTLLYPSSAYRMNLAQQCIYIKLKKAEDNNGDLPAVDCEGVYTGYIVEDLDGQGQPNGDATAWLKCDTKTDTIKVHWYWDYTDPNNPWVVLEISLFNADGDILYSYTSSSPSSHYLYNYYLNGEYTLMAALSGMVGRYQASAKTTNFYGRYVCDTPQASVQVRGISVTVYDRPIEDITTTGLNYMRIFPCGMNIYTQGNIFISGRTTTTPNKWGDNDGAYWLPPTDDAEYYPLYHSEWVQGVSYWVLPLQTSVGDAVQVKYTIPDAFAINDVIAALLTKIDPSITHKGTTAYSAFLYGKNPISNLAQRLYITPKSNAILSEYSMAAKKGTITLKMILDMLCKVFRLYWYIDTSNRLRIEHYKWWAQGKSYTSDAWQIGADLTTLKDYRNGKAWGFGKNQYTFDKQEMPERYTFKWMDDVSAIFDGQPIILQSPLVEQDRKEEQSISNFTTDLGYMLLSGTEVSKEGFALIGTRLKNSELYNGKTYTMTGVTTRTITIYGETDYYDITLKVSATNTSGQPQTIEYGIVQQVEGVTTYYKRGEIPCASTAVVSTKTISSPSRDFVLYFRSSTQSTAYSCSMTITEIQGGIEEVPVVSNADSYHYPINDNIPYHNAHGVTQQILALEVSIPPYVQYVAASSDLNKRIYVNFTNVCTNGYIDITVVPYTGTPTTLSTHYTTGTYSIDVTVAAAKLQFNFHLNSGASSGAFNIKVNSLTFDSQMQVSSVNYYLSLQYLLPTYWAYGLPVSQASFNGEEAVTTTLVAKNRTQTAKLPIGNHADPDTEKKVKTFCGIGMLSKMSVPLSSRVAVLTLKQDMQ